MVEYEGRYFCEPDPANEMTVAEFQAKSAMDGAASDGNDFIVLEELRVDASLHRRHEDDPEELGDHWIKVKFTGKVNLAPVGMRISAALTFDTEETGKVESVKLNADLSYRSPDGLINFDVGLQGTFGNCVSAEDSWFLKGSVVLAFPESGVTAEGTVDGVRYCEKNSEDIRGHSYAIDVTASVEYIPVEGVRLAVEDFAATMKGSQRPGDVDNGGRIVWTGVISATTSLSVEDGALEPAFFSNPGLSVSADIAVNIHKSTVKSVDFTVTNAEMTGDGWSVRLWTELISLPSKPGDKIIIHGEAKIDQAAGELSVEKMEATLTYVVPGGDVDEEEEERAVTAKEEEDDDSKKTPGRELAGSIVLKGHKAVLAGAEWESIDIQAQVFRLLDSEDASSSAAVLGATSEVATKDRKSVV